MPAVKIFSALNLNKLSKNLNIVLQIDDFKVSFDDFRKPQFLGHIEDLVDF